MLNVDLDPRYVADIGIAKAVVINAGLGVSKVLDADSNRVMVSICPQDSQQVTAPDTISVGFVENGSFICLGQMNTNGNAVVLRLKDYGPIVKGPIYTKAGGSGALICVLALSLLH